MCSLSSVEALNLTYQFSTYLCFLKGLNTLHCQQLTNTSENLQSVRQLNRKHILFCFKYFYYDNLKEHRATTTMIYLYLSWNYTQLYKPKQEWKQIEALTIRRHNPFGGSTWRQDAFLLPQLCGVQAHGGPLLLVWSPSQFILTSCFNWNMNTLLGL